MSRCIKTGARIYLSEYGSTHAADIHEVDSVLVIRHNTAPISFSREDATHSLYVGAGFIESSGVHGTIVIPAEQLAALH